MATMKFKLGFRPRKGCELQLPLNKLAWRIRNGFRPREGCELQQHIILILRKIYRFRPREGCELQLHIAVRHIIRMVFPSP